MIEEYIRHPEAKSLGPDGTPCTAETRGLLQRAHITAGRIRYIDKETSSMSAQGDDLSVVTDSDETGFRMVEYGESRKVVLPESLKRQIQGTKLQRELRRRGIGQHTIEKAPHAKVRVNTYRKILSAIEEYKREKVHDPGKESLCHTKDPERKRQWERQHREQRNARRKEHRLDARSGPPTVSKTRYDTPVALGALRRPAPDPVSGQKAQPAWKALLGLAVGIGVVLLAAFAGVSPLDSGTHGSTPK